MSSRGSVMETDLRVDRKLMEINFFGPIAITKGIDELIGTDMIDLVRRSCYWVAF